MNGEDVGEDAATVVATFVAEWPVLARIRSLVCDNKHMYTYRIHRCRYIRSLEAVGY